MLWLVLASLVFYSVGNWQFVPLLAASVAFNYFIGWLLIEKQLRSTTRFAVLTVGIAGDLVVLGTFKYAGFFAANINAMFSTGFIVNILLPVGISFYTFTQIAFLVDAWRGNVARYGLPYYAVFVTYFPHLIAGPILHHKDIIPQFESERTKRPDPHLILAAGKYVVSRAGRADGPAEEPSRGLPDRRTRTLATTLVIAGLDPAIHPL